MKRLSYEQKYALYCEFVQDPSRDISFLNRIYKKFRNGKEALRVKEDFCGSFFFSTEWVKSRKNRSAVAVDIDWEPLRQGYHTYYNQLNTDQKNRLTIIQGDVCHKFGESVDVNFASNFSYNCIKERSKLKQYFESVYENLDKKGIFVMDNFGGADTLAPYLDRTAGRLNGQKWYYEWELKRYNPNTSEALYYIHFSRSKTRREYPKVFTYDWRMWSLPELKDILLEVGFKDVIFYWEDDRDNYVINQKGDTNLSTWVVHVVGIK